VANDQVPPFYSTFDTAKLLGVDMTTVIDWCQQGRLPAFKTPGGHRRISARDLVNFLREYKMPVPSALNQAAVLTCLVVDDEPEVCRWVAGLIKSAFPDAEVENAGDGFEAGKKAAELLPRLVVLDIGLPGVDGLRVCESLRHDDRYKATKILVVSEKEGADLRQRILSAGADDFLPKPLESKEFKERLTILLA
jgi:excisionase family DNA binding protein